MNSLFFWIVVNLFTSSSIAYSSPDIIPLGTLSSPPLGDIITTLSTLQRKPTCYRTAATSLIHHCASLTSDIPDPDRIHFAVKLTCCELDLINQTPSACRLETQWRECVRLLASQDHWWTTFSGNLKEVTNVCWIGRREVEKDQLLDLHANLTDVQSRLLEILREHVDEAKVQEGHQQVIQKQWNEFTVSLRQNLDVISMNTTTLLRDLFSGLLRLQSFTRDSTRLVAEELRTLEEEVSTIRGGISQVNNELDTLGEAEVARVEKLGEITEQQLTLVEIPLSNVDGQIQRILDTVYTDGLFPISQHLTKINDELSTSRNITISLMEQLNDRLLSYLTIAGESSQLFAKQADALSSISTQITSMSEKVEHNIRHLEEGFETLRESLHLTKLSVLSLAGGSKVWLIAAAVGFILGSFGGFFRWIVTGVCLLFMASHTPLSFLQYRWLAFGCLGAGMGFTGYFLYSKASKWRERATLQNPSTMMRGWHTSQDKSYYLDG